MSVSFVTRLHNNVSLVYLLFQHAPRWTCVFTPNQSVSWLLEWYMCTISHNAIHIGKQTIHSGTSLMRTPLVPSKTSLLRRLPVYFSRCGNVYLCHWVLRTKSCSRTLIPCWTLVRKVNWMLVLCILVHTIMLSCWINQQCSCFTHILLAQSAVVHSVHIAMILYIGILNAWRQVRGKIASGEVTVV